MYDVLITNARIPQGDDTKLTNILVRDGIIEGFLQDIEGIKAKEIIDAESHLTLPGCIDPHTHINDPGFTHRENFFTGTSAAATGGITMIIDMPCCSKPSVRSVEQLENKVNAIKNKAIVDYGMWGGVTGEDVRNDWLFNVREQADFGVLAFKVYMTPSVPTYPRVSDPEMLEAFKAVSETGLIVGVHSEIYAICEFYTKKFEREGRTDAPAWAEARKAISEKLAIQMGIYYAEEVGARFQVVHMALGEGARMVREAKMRGVDVVAETCPHYLFFNYQESMTKHGVFAKIAPPLRTKKDNELLWKGLQDGSIDFIGTDHAPYEVATEKTAKGLHIWNAFPGIPGVETMVPVIVSEGYNKGRISLSRLVELLCKNAAINFGLYPKKGSMFVGTDADFTIIDLDREWTIKNEEMVTMAKYGPFDGMKLKGKPVKTIVRGKLVYDDKKGIVGEQGYGKLIKRQNENKLQKILKF
ncbi:MAG: dihydroorotase [Clostridiales bacterium]|nr:dihydroorotase [Clostridiales bacterium]